MNQNSSARLWITVLVSALGYLVDIYDIMIFSVVRVASLRDVGVAESDLTHVGLSILNWQMVGMLIGGLLWGVIGDKRGRLTVLFGSIFLYSSASLMNVFITNADQYTFLRFLAGVGLAGELGAGVTLASELLPSRSRGYGTMLIAGIGVFGGILAGTMGQLTDWKACYLLGAALGFGLLLIRITVVESGLFQKLSEKNVRRGDLRLLFGDRELLLRYFRCLFLAVPSWMLFGMFTTLAPELAAEVGISDTLTSGQALLYVNIGAGLGDFSCSWISQRLHSRKRALYLYLLTLLVLILFFKFGPLRRAQDFLWLYLGLGVCAGYWAVFLMSTAEQFGTNLRATVTTSAPNFVRATIVPLSFIFQLLRPEFGVRASMTLMTLTMTILALLSLRSMSETFDQPLDYLH